MSIAFDPDKDARNIAKHRISLARAEEMDMSAALVHEDDRFDYGERRYIAFGDIDDVFALSRFHLPRQQGPRHQPSRSEQEGN